MVIKVKRAQITLWVILSVVLVASVVLFFIVNNSKIKFVNKEIIENPMVFIEKCTEKSIKEAEAIMLMQGGFISPTNYIQYKENKITYLCENTGNYLPCINQHPMLIEEMKKEIENYAIKNLSVCLIQLKNEVERRNGKIIYENPELNIKITKGRIVGEITGKVTISSDDGLISFDKLIFDIKSPMYDLVQIAMEIANQEARYCYFEYVGYMILHPEIKIEKISLSDSTKIYTIFDKLTEKEMNIAVRGCAIPPGL